jgi:hypothetical protein
MYVYNICVSWVYCVHYRESWPKISPSSSRAIWTHLSRPGMEPQTPCTIGRHSRKEPSRQLILLSIRSTIYARILSTLFHGFLPCFMAPPSICVQRLRTTLTHDTHILIAGVQRSLFHDLTEWTSVLRFTEAIHFLWWSDHVGVTTIENLDQRYLYPPLEEFGHICPGLGLNPRPPAPLAGTLEKSHLDSLYYCPFESLLMQGFYPLYFVDFFPATLYTYVETCTSRVM